MNDATWACLPVVLKERLREAMVDRWHGQIMIDFQDGTVYRWSVTEYGRPPKKAAHNETADMLK